MLKIVVNDFRLFLGKILGFESVVVKFLLENKGIFFVKLLKNCFLLLEIKNGIIININNIENIVISVFCNILCFMSYFLFILFLNFKVDLLNFNCFVDFYKIE